MTIATAARERAPAPIASAVPRQAPAAGIMAAGLPASLLVFAWAMGFDRRLVWHDRYAALAATLAFIALAAPLFRRGLLGRTLVAVVHLGTLLLVIASADRALAAWEERAPEYAPAATFASSCLNVLGYRTAVEQGLLLLDHPDGVVAVAPSMEKLAVRPLLLFWLVWAALRLLRDHRRAAAEAAVALGATAFVGLARYVVLLALYAEHDDILAGSSGLAALDLFTSPWITGAFLVVAGLAADRGGRLLLGAPTASLAPASGRPNARAIAFGGAATAGLAAAAGLAWFFAPPGAEKAGRILVDDRFCGIWEPTARQLDTAWYGDFPTYSFTSLAEWLGKWFSVDVNTTRTYDDQLLSGYNVLVLKTPEEAIPDEEIAAINRFVRSGGGLLLVGDHTNLLGMGTHLNALCANHGIRFRYDSVSDGITGGFVDYVAPRLGRHIGALHVNELEFMTSCSLQISGDAETVLAADNCRREPHDYAGSSFFGRRGAHPEMAHGRTVLAAAVRVGRGRIAAFTDSTVWSSFAVFSHDRQKLAMDLVRLLNREPSPYELPIRGLAVAAALIAAFVGLAMVRSGLALPAILCGLLGLWSGAALSEGLHHWLYAWPKPNAPVSEVAFLWQGGACAFPPVLGTPDSIPADRSFDTLLVAVQRLGLVPRVAFTYDKDLFTPETRAIFVIAPVNTPPAETMARLKDFVCRGGCLIVLDDNRIGERGSAKDFLGLFGATIIYHGAQGRDGNARPHVHLGGGMERVSAPAADAFVARKLVEQGQVVYLSDAADFSRKGLGHCFARPWKTARARYETIYGIFRDVLRITPGDRRFYRIL